MVLITPRLTKLLKRLWHRNKILNSNDKVRLRLRLRLILIVVIQNSKD
jgi:hypothetical protein